MFGDITLFKSESMPRENTKIIVLKKKISCSNNIDKKTITIKKPPVNGISLFVVNF